jgi:ERF superfamily
MDIVADRAVLVTTLSHLSGEYIKSVLPLNPVKNDPQSMGAAITYARRYALAAIAGVCPSDDDAESAMNRNGTHNEPEGDEENLLTEEEGAQLDYYLDQVSPTDVDELCKKLRIKSIYEMKKKSFKGSIDWCMKKISSKTDKKEKTA